MLRKQRFFDSLMQPAYNLTCILYFASSLFKKYSMQRLQKEHIFGCK